MQDPDCFVVKKEYLNFLEAFFKEGKVAVGTPYEAKIGIGYQDFPNFFSGAVRIKDVLNTDWTPFLKKGEKYYDRISYKSLEEKVQEYVKLSKEIYG